MFGKGIQFKIERLTADTRNFVGSFSCGNLEINDYINNEEAFYDCETVTYLLLEKDDNDQFTKLIGFLSLSCSAIIKDLDSVDSDGRPYDELVPAALIEYFAITEEYHGMPYDQGEDITFSEVVFSMFIVRIMRILKEFIGAQYIILCATKEAYNFYRKCNFGDFEEDMGYSNDPHTSDCIPMYLMVDCSKS